MDIQRKARRLGPAPQSELAQRREQISFDLRDLGADALLASREGVVTYLTGYTTSTWSNFSRPIYVVLHADARLAIVAAETEIDAIRERVPAADVRPYIELREVSAGDPLPDGAVQFAPHAIEVLANLLRSWRISRPAVDGLGAAHPPIGQPVLLLPQVAATAVDASALIWKRRLIKSDWECEKLAEACDILAGAMDTLGAEIEPGMTEREIHGALAAASFLHGADELGYTNVVAGVERGLFGAPTDRIWNPGHVLFVDGGIKVDGYWADFCRMYVADEPTQQQAKAYNRAHQGLQAAVEVVHCGMTAGALAAVIAHATDLDPSAVGFGRFGHGIGLYMPEPPSLHPSDSTRLEAGVTLCIEPAVLASAGNYVVEEEFVVTGEGLKSLSPAAPPTLISVPI